MISVNLFYVLASCKKLEKYNERILRYTFFLLSKNNFIRMQASYFVKNYEQAKAGANNHKTKNIAKNKRAQTLQKKKKEHSKGHPNTLFYQHQFLKKCNN